MPAAAAQFATRAPISGTIDHMLVDDFGDTWSSGWIVVGGQNVLIPRNLIIDLPANRMSLQQLFDQAPPAARALGESGLASSDATSLGHGAHATILANRLPSGNIVAGSVLIEKGTESVLGEVTYINYTQGYFRLNGAPGSDATGVMVRINDPTARYTIQRGKGCTGGPNGSPDVRFGVDADNYTVTFATGYPACLPSTMPVGQRPGALRSDPSDARSDLFGQGDPFCPCENRLSSPVPDSTRFAPIMLGDTLSAEGNFEQVNATRFFSAHSVEIFAKLSTIDSPTQPDYMIFDDVDWAVAGYQNQGMEVIAIGRSTLPNSQFDLFKLHTDPATGLSHEFIVATTFNNPSLVHTGTFPVGDSIFFLEYELSFQFENEIPGMPCVNVLNGGFPACSNPVSTADNFKLLHPVPREVIGRTKHKAVLADGITTRDLNGFTAPNGEYLTPVHHMHPDFAGIDLHGGATPFVFEGLPWLLDRRLGPGGDGPEGVPQPLEPFPASGLDPRAQALVPAAAADKILSYYPFGPGDVLDWQTAPFAGPAILPTPAPVLPCDQTFLVPGPTGSMTAIPNKGHVK